MFSREERLDRLRCVQEYRRGNVDSLHSNIGKSILQRKKMPVLKGAALAGSRVTNPYRRLRGSA